MTLRELMDNVTIQGDVCLSLFDDNGDEIAICEIMGVTDHLSEYDLKKAKRTVTYYGNNAKIPGVFKWANYEVSYLFCLGDGHLHIELRETD